MYFASSNSQPAYPWQSPEFLSQLDRSLLPQAQRPAPPKPKKEKERLYKQVTRRTLR